MQHFKSLAKNKITIVAVAVLLVGGVAFGILHTSKPTAANDSQASANPAPGDLIPVQQGVSSAESTSATPQKVLDISGKGSSQTESFTTNESWQVDYTYDCAAFGQKGIYQYYVFNTDGTPNTDVGANEYSMNGSGTNHYYDSGTHYFKVNTTCDWHIVVTQ